MVFPGSHRYIIINLKKEISKHTRFSRISDSRNEHKSRKSDVPTIPREVHRTSYDEFFTRANVHENVTGLKLARACVTQVAELRAFADIHIYRDALRDREGRVSASYIYAIARENSSVVVGNFLGVERVRAHVSCACIMYIHAFERARSSSRITRARDIVHCSEVVYPVDSSENDDCLANVWIYGAIIRFAFELSGRAILCYIGSLYSFLV